MSSVIFFYGYAFEMNTFFDLVEGVINKGKSEQDFKPFRDFPTAEDVKGVREVKRMFGKMQVAKFGDKVYLYAPKTLKQLPIEENAPNKLKNGFFKQQEITKEEEAEYKKTIKDYNLAKSAIQKGWMSLLT